VIKILEQSASSSAEHVLVIIIICR